jgi:hypothetical protein
MHEKDEECEVLATSFILRATTYGRRNSHYTTLNLMRYEAQI